MSNRASAHTQLCSPNTSICRVKVRKEFGYKSAHWNRCNVTFAPPARLSTTLKVQIFDTREIRNNFFGHGSKDRDDSGGLLLHPLPRLSNLGGHFLHHSRSDGHGRHDRCHHSVGRVTSGSWTPCTRRQSGQAEAGESAG